MADSALRPASPYANDRRGSRGGRVVRSGRHPPPTVLRLPAWALPASTKPRPKRPFRWSAMPLGSDRDQLATKADLAALGAATRADLAAAVAGLERRLSGYGLAIAGLLFAALKLFRHTADAIQAPPCPRDRP